MSLSALGDVTITALAAVPAALRKLLLTGVGGGGLQGERGASRRPCTWPRCTRDVIRELEGSRYLVSADDVREAAEEPFILMVTFHQEVEVFLGL